MIGVLRDRHEAVRRRDEQLAAGRRPLDELAEEATRIGEVLDHLEGHDEVEALADRAELRHVERAEREIAQAMPRGCDRDRLGAVDRHDAVRVPRQQRRAVSLAASDVEHALPRSAGGREPVGCQVALEIDGEVAAGPR